MSGRIGLRRIRQGVLQARRAKARLAAHLGPFGAASAHNRPAAVVELIAPTGQPGALCFSLSMGTRGAREFRPDTPESIPFVTIS
jgi:hypothetical protein